MANPQAPGREFLNTYCIDCHGPHKQKGDRRFDELASPPQNELDIIEFQDIIDQLNLGDMPPSKADQPTEEEVAQAIKAFTQQVAQASESLESSGGQTVLRRLNRREYLNTIEDLVGCNMETFDPTTKFPTDQKAEHMDNVGAALVTSGYLLDQYLDAADAVIDRALGMTEKPEPQSWTFNKDFDQGQELQYSHKRVYNFRYLCVYEVPNTTNHEGGYAAIEKFKEGVPADGFYTVKVLAHALNRDHPYKDSIFGTDFSDPFRLGIVPGDHTVGLLHHPQPIEPQLAEVTIKDADKPQWYEMSVWLDKGQTPRFIFPNGMANCRQAFARIARDYKSHWPKDDPYKGGIVEARRIVLQHGQMPHIRIHEVQIDGPHFDAWPPPAQKLVYGEKGFQAENTREILNRFADRAYRRPATREEVDRLMQIVATREAVGRTPREACNDALKAVLCSPSFLYLAEPGSKSLFRRGKAAEFLNAHDLASRLSYFLWSTMPDEELRQTANDNSLLNPKVLQEQLDRMLKDKRSDEFIAAFLDAWLNLRYLGEMPPDRSAFGEYYSQSLEEAMKSESQLFTRHLIESDGPITDYLDADYSFLNKPLAEHYDLKDAVAQFAAGEGHIFQRVSLPEKSHRGGLLGMASVLTVTANGIETSPVTRGVWLLENVFGTPPSPPPDNVPPIDPDIRGATTIRDQLSKHRESTTCYECHRKIDPPGFALENYDPIGGWRSRYPKGNNPNGGPPIDASGELASGEAFGGVEEFKKLLQSPNRVKLFTSMLTERLLSYSTGRRLDPSDHQEVERIAAEVAEADYGMRTLIQKVVASEAFRME